MTWKCHVVKIVAVKVLFNGLIFIHLKIIAEIIGKGECEAKKSKA